MLFSSYEDLAASEYYESSTMMIETIWLKNILAILKKEGYDHIFIDTPPTLGSLTVSFSRK